ncbi:Gfo/Idh/MocA family protein [Thermogemmatispora tikiterensis]|uniref:Oxidoreductase n=1 Tax=Thermogemmatispora tikiterensis TaxID=1825093 RepID=A0A328VNW2_9CHLR|nr:Gfo/Idh/MocA family oxidoreductase [Thermogemmatispora tikiterensis]RAQ95855.1 oxidoreductase [Thermogemmatispora tikiterensis]
MPTHEAARLRKVRLGLIGGGPGSNIGPAHRYAALLDGRYALLTGVFSSDPERSRAFAAELGIAGDRRYGRWQEMLEAEAHREDGVEVISIMTPNRSHYPIAKACLEQGFDVICDKPLTTTLEEALDLLQLSRSRGLICAVTYNYSGYPMVRQAREMVRRGELGNIRIVQVEHASGWASTLLEATGHKQATWRTTPEMVGKSSVVADLGTHAHHLLRFITGLEVVELSAELATLVPGRQVDDNAHIKLRLSNGARGFLWASMAATGHLHGLRIRVYGEDASLEWVQERPEELIVRPLNDPQQILMRGFEWLAPSAQRSSRLWPGHPEGFLEAFANLYNDIAEAILARRSGQTAPKERLFPDVEDGVLGVQFIEAAVSSHLQQGNWVKASLDLLAANP